ncbi:hypothetical protein FTUN_8968 [Frigoriglobus tundricola]|uniref:Uncharacterized protein n=1 Tax=Frigoriglobus tundricola TaxID=2774151 RepID=A0A6M5Z7G2_9BACT|nr:hypothetical protein FTUN_8968 [Frigoriglobus tundricola]
MLLACDGETALNAYRSREAFEARIRGRCERPPPLTVHAVFHPAALTPDGPPVVPEQLEPFAPAGLGAIRAFVLAAARTDERRFRDATQHDRGASRSGRPGTRVRTLRGIDARGDPDGRGVLRTHDRRPCAIGSPQAEVAAHHGPVRVGRPEAARVGRKWPRVAARSPLRGAGTSGPYGPTGWRPFARGAPARPPDSPRAGATPGAGASTRRHGSGAGRSTASTAGAWGARALWPGSAFALDEWVPEFDSAAPRYLGEPACIT